MGVKKDFYLATKITERYHRCIMSRTSILLAILLTSLPCLADDAPPKPTSPAAVAADKEYQHAVEAAEQAYKTAKANATKRLVEKLSGAMKAATRAGNLAEANAIDAEIKTVQAGSLSEHAAASKDDEGVTFWVWRWHYAEGEANVWLMADGRCINHQGKPGHWKQSGSEVKFDWGFERDTFTLRADKTFTGKNVDTGKAFTGEIIGTNLTGAASPPATK